MWTDGGVGNDWGVFRVFNNSNTGLQPISAQNASFTLAQDFGPSTIRITGYGVDGGTRNQTQQTHAGPNDGSSGTTMRYRTDTEGGNSGSPVIDEATGRAVGVHTHGGCSFFGGSNKGTSTFNSAFWNALDVSSTGTGSITATLTSSTTLPSSGGLVSGDFTLSNTSNATFDGEWWIQVTLPNGNSGPRLGPFPVSLGSGESQTESVSKNVPAGAQAGVYLVESFIGPSFPDDIDDSDSFSFFKNGMLKDAGGALVVEAPEVWTLTNHTRSAVQTVVVANAEQRAVPALEGAFPNPLSASTDIRYSLPNDGAVRLVVYDVLGREVAVLADGHQAAGFHRVVFNATGLGTGVYLYKLYAGSYTDTQRLTVRR